MRSKSHLPSADAHTELTSISRCVDRDSFHQRMHTQSQHLSAEAYTGPASISGSTHRASIYQLMRTKSQLPSADAHTESVSISGCAYRVSFHQRMRTQSQLPSADAYTEPVSISGCAHRARLSRVFGRLTANANIATVLGSIPASSGRVECIGAADEAVLNIVHKICPNWLFKTAKILILLIFCLNYRYNFSDCVHDKFLSTFFLNVVSSIKIMILFFQ
jgi:hypothetical protein